MARTIRLFMWGYQDIFQISAQSSAESLLQLLDPNLKPTVFLVGILVDAIEDSHPICLEPEDCGYSTDSFSDVLEQSKHFEAIDEERNIFHSHPSVQENHVKRIKLRALKNAIFAAVNGGGKYRGKASFCSWPVRLEGYMVCTVLQLDKKSLDAHYSLEKEKAFDRYSVSTSLIDATITEFLDGCAAALRKPDPGSGLGILEREYDEIIRDAGKYLVRTVAWAVNKPEYSQGLFEALNVISSLRYEGAESIGNMLIAEQGHPNVKASISLLSPVPINNYRAARKLLEISSEKDHLLCDGSHFYGLGRKGGLYNFRREDLFTVDFRDHYQWDLLHAKHILMHVAYRQPQLPRPKIHKKKFESDLPRIFPDISSENVEKLWSLILKAIEQRHGTLVVITSDARKEAIRLEQQATRIEPLKLNPEMMELVTAIDGAILISPDTTCYAIGVILDGIATEKGNPGRGARYNSAVRYVDGKDECLAIIVSEDGSVDLVPDLMPQISRNSVFDAIKELEELKNQDDVDIKKFNQTMSWLEYHRFYLLEDVCSQVNQLREQIEEKIKDIGAIRLVYPKFVPSEEMNDSFFLD